MSHRPLRIARALFGFGVALYLALTVTVIVRFVDAVLDLSAGAWVAFDDAGAGLNEPMVSALWEQWRWLWCAAWIWWPVAMGVLAAALRRTAPTTDLGVGHAVLSCVIPVLSSALSVDVFRRVRDALVSTLGDDPLAARVARWAAIIPWLSLASPALLTVALVTVGRSSPTMGARVAVTAAVLLPLSLPVGLRSLQLLSIVRALSAVEERLAVAHVRAQRSTSTAG
jgi:hypothetical protein